MKKKNFVCTSFMDTLTLISSLSGWAPVPASRLGNRFLYGLSQHLDTNFQIVPQLNSDESETHRTIYLTETTAGSSQIHLKSIPKMTSSPPSQTSYCNLFIPQPQLHFLQCAL
jgi:hypothetical protein